MKTKSKVLASAPREVSPREYARRTGLRLDTTYAAIWAGRIEARQVDGRWRIPESAVQDVLRNKRSGADGKN
jgi:excisionase family DNA binding protein